MSKEIKILETAIPYLKLQRKYCVDENGNFDELRYKQIINDEANAIISEISEPVNSFLSIGCGIPSLEILLFSFFNPQKMFLVDGTGNATPGWYNYNFEEPEYMNSMVETELHLNNNGINDKYFLELPTEEIDLVVSSLSFGFGYSWRVSPYRDIVLEFLKVGGYIVLDLRVGSFQDDIPSSDLFDEVAIIKSRRKSLGHLADYDRVLFRRK